METNEKDHPHTEHGDRDLALGGEILRTVVGSGVHGLAIPGTDDHDEMGVYIEPPVNVIGLGDSAQHYVYRTQPEGARSGPGDTDLVSYSLHKFLRLAIKGNPTALLPLYAPRESIIRMTVLGAELRDLAPKMLSRGAVHRFLGYLEAQRSRLLGKSQGKVPSRPELIEKYGYDVKYASHALRLAYQGLEVARDARLTLPMPAEEREQVLAVKRGEVKQLDVVLKKIADVEEQVEDLLTTGRTPLPEKPDVAEVSEWAVGAHRRHWGWD